MIKVDIKALLGKLDKACTSAMQGAAGLCVARTHYEIGVEHFIYKLLEDPKSDVSLIVLAAGDLAFILSPQKDSFQDLSDGYGLAEASDRFQVEYIKRAIKRVQGNMSEAARVLGLHRSNLYRKMRQLGMQTGE